MGYIETPDQFKQNTKDKLNELKTAIQAAATESKTITPATINTDPAMKAKADALSVKSVELKKALADKIAEIKARFPSDARVNAATDALIARVNKILGNSAIAVLKTELDLLHAETAPAAPAPAPGTKKFGEQVEDVNTALAGAAVPPSEDLQTPQEVDAGKGALQNMGLLKYQSIFKMAMSFYSMWSSINKLTCMGDQACIQGVDKNVKNFQDQYDAHFGMPEARDGFNAILKNSGITVQPGKNDAAAFARLRDLQKQNPGKTRDVLIAEIAQEYLTGKGAKTNHVTTMAGILFGRDSVESPQKTLIGDAASEVKVKDAAGAEKSFNVQVKDDTVIVDGKTFKLQAEDGSSVAFEQADFWKRGDVASLFLTVAKDGKRVLALPLDSSAKVLKFLEDIKGGTAPILPPGVLSSWFGYKSSPVAIKLVLA